MILFKQHTPAWLIFLLDFAIVAFSVVMSYLLRFNFNVPDSELVSVPIVMSIILTIRTLSFFIFKTFSSIIRYTSSSDAVRIFLVIFGGSILFSFVNLGTFYTQGIFIIPFSIIIIDFLITTFLMSSFRLLVKIIYLEFMNPNREKADVIIYGAGEAGLITKRTLDRDAGTKYRVIAFLDDDEKKQGKKLENVSIHPVIELDELLKENNIAQIIIAIGKVSTKRKQHIIEKALEYNIQVLTIPPVSQWINGELSFKQIKEVKIEDLLEREVIELDKYKLGSELTGKTILVTGACGSIGSEIVRQLAAFPCEKILILDQAETPMYNLEVELLVNFRTAHFEFILCDVNDTIRMRNVFEAFKPQMVYHAAAYKHVPVMESNPYEAVLVNVSGTRNLADLSDEFEVDKFVMISTDKAVNPTNVMGASKRIAEIYIQALSQISKTKFITTRFGNVLGSNGSVIPLFKEQIAKRGPVTVTHPDITRYFMTIPEACQLVLEAGNMGHGGEIFMFDMGESVKIVDLAKKMIQLSGLTLGKDIQIVFSGLRPGEKLYEELLSNKENTLPTHHPKILIAKVELHNIDTVKQKVDELILKLAEHNNLSIVSEMKQLVPEYKSQNSVFEQLDKS